MKPKRKRWTPSDKGGDRSRDTKKWQIALRRYIIGQKGSFAYAVYFGVDTVMFRTWIELFFERGMGWTNFGTAWKFEHIVPVSYFDPNSETDLKICWNFMNIRPASLTSFPPDIISARRYFEQLHTLTGFPVCADMLQIIDSTPIRQEILVEKQANFLLAQKQYFEDIQGFDEYDFSRLNEGSAYKEILLEKNILRKFGS